MTRLKNLKFKDGWRESLTGSPRCCDGCGQLDPPWCVMFRVRLQQSGMFSAHLARCAACLNSSEVVTNEKA